MKYIDINGKIDYSKIVELSLNSETIDDLNNLIVKPNPSAESTKLYFSTSKEEKMELKVLSTNSTLVLQKEFIANPGENGIEISTKELTSGMYFIILQSKSGTRTCKLIKQ